MAAEHDAVGREPNRLLSTARRARRLGFEPAPDFGPAAGHLGPWEETSAITFGRDGAPLYVQGPYDDPNTVLRTLSKSAGEENFHFATVADAAGGR